jgi:hypothetical protein
MSHRSKSAPPGQQPEPFDLANKQPEGEEFPFGANVEQPAEPTAETEQVTEPPPGAEALDPFDPMTYRVSQTLAAAAGVKPHLTDLAVRMPDKAWWVRCHPDPEFSFATWVIELKDERETYLVIPRLWPSLMGEATFKPKTFTLTITMQGKLFLWGVRRPADDTKEPDRWMRAPLEAVRRAKKQWTRIAWNEATQQHDVLTCDSTAELEWPDLPMREILKLAFKGLVIDTPDHPVLRRLRGETR